MHASASLLQKKNQSLETVMAAEASKKFDNEIFKRPKGLISRQYFRWADNELYKKIKMKYIYHLD